MPDKSPLTLPLLPNVENIDTSKVNLAGYRDPNHPEIANQLDELMDQRNKYMTALEDRYKNPNWFKIAAGFAKPQLGGFAASLGSAAEAAGDWQEQQRAVTPTIAKMKAENAAFNLNLGHQKIAQDILNDRLSKPGGLTSIDVAEIARHSPEIGKIAQEKFTNQGSTFGQLVQAIQAGNSMAEIKSKFPVEFVDANYAAAKSLVPGNTAQNQPGAVNPSAPMPNPNATNTGTRTPIPGIDVNSLSLDAYQRALQKYSEDQQAKYQDLTKNTITQANGGRNVYETTQQIHDIASSPVLSNVFARFEKGSPSDILGMLAEKQGFSSALAGMRDYIVSSDIKDKPGALTKLNQLGSLMGRLQTEMQNAVINPTDERTQAEFASLPNTKNTQDAFLRTIRYLGNEGLTKYEHQLALQRAKDDPRFDPNFFNTHPEYTGVLQNSSKRRDAIVNTPATQDRPSFMKGSIDEAAFKGNRKEKPTAETKSSTGSETPKRRFRKALDIIDEANKP